MKSIGLVVSPKRSLSFFFLLKRQSYGADKELKQICVSSLNTQLSFDSSKRVNNKEMAIWYCASSTSVIPDDCRPRGVPLSSESHFQLWLCVTLDLQGLQHKSCSAGIEGTEKKKREEDMFLLLHVFVPNNASSEKLRVINTSNEFDI